MVSAVLSLAHPPLPVAQSGRRADRVKSPYGSTLDSRFSQAPVRSAARASHGPSHTRNLPVGSLDECDMIDNMHLHLRRSSQAPAWQFTHAALSGIKIEIGTRSRVLRLRRSSKPERQGTAGRQGWSFRLNRGPHMSVPRERAKNADYCRLRVSCRTFRSLPGSGSIHGTVRKGDFGCC